MYTYSPTEVTILIAGTAIEGWERVAIIPEQPTFRMIKGIRGKNARVKNNDTSAIIEVEVDQTSDANILFSEILRQDYASGNGRMEVTIKDGLGFDLFNTNQAYISSPPIRTFGATSEVRLWTIHCLMSNNMEYNMGSPLSNIFDGFSSLFN